MALLNRQSCKNYDDRNISFSLQVDELKFHEFKVAMSCEGCSAAVNRVLGRLESMTTTHLLMEKLTVVSRSVKVPQIAYLSVIWYQEVVGC